MKRTSMHWCCVVSCVLVLGWTSPVLSDEHPDDPAAPVVENEDSADDISQYQYAAQAAHASNLAEATYEIDTEINALIGQLAVAESEEPQDQGEITGLEAEIERREEEIQAEITEMRASGMGWGEIAHALGVHPGVLGLGHSKKDAKVGVDAELAMATTMDMKTGNSMGHGKAYDDGTATSKNGNGNGGTQGNQKDKSEDKGNKGGNGNGNGKNK